MLVLTYLPTYMHKEDQNACIYRSVGYMTNLILSACDILSNLSIIHVSAFFNLIFIKHNDTVQYSRSVTFS